MHEGRTARDIAHLLNAQLTGVDRAVDGIAPLSEAKANQVTFVVDPSANEAPLSTALSEGAIVLAPPGTDAAGTIILVENPRLAFARVVAECFVAPVEPGIASTARVDPSARIDPSATIGEFTVVRAGAVIGPFSEVRDHVVIGRNVLIGAHALIKSHAVIGEEGFGMERDDEGNNLRIPHVGAVVLGDHVEVGGFTTVCSGTIAPTRVGDYTKIDDHVHVAHNCRIGRNVIITACAEISGSVVIDDDAWIGPNASVIQGVSIGRNALLGLGAVALKPIPDNEVRVGNPARRLGDNPPRTQ